MNNEHTTERYLCLTELRQVFTEKHIKAHFRRPDKLGRNNNVSKSYAQRHDLESKLYLFSRVEAAIKAGVPHRFKNDIDPKLMHDILSLKLPIKQTKEKPKKI